MSNGELDLSSISPTEVERLHGIMDAGSTEIERVADDDVRLCLLALSGTTEVSSCSEGAEVRNQSANSRFRSPRFVGSGSFGIVFFVFDNALGIEVAIKLLRPSRNSPVVQKRFLEEARITANLTHPGIIRLFDSGTVGQIPYITSAIVSGGSLADWIAKHPQGMKSEVACQVLLSVAEAVSFAHSKLTYHRDIKPSNILMHSESHDPSDVRPVLTDFGLAKRWDKTESALTLEGDILGTARYMSPEQASGALDDYSVASEVFSLGIVLYELLTGKVPFDGKSSTEVRKAIIHGRLVPIRQANPELSSDLTAIVQKCLEKAPELRYDSVSALAKDLQRYILGQPVEASSPSFLRMTIWNAKRHPIVTGSIGLAILTISLSLIAVGYSWWNQVRIAKREQQTKIEYVVLFGKLVDDVVAGQKNQQTAILESLNGFQSALEKDLQERPADPDLRHLMSLVLHYRCLTLERVGQRVEAMNSRINSVGILKNLRFEFPDNSKFRFQYIYGMMMMSEMIDDPLFAELKPALVDKTGHSSGLELINAVLPEMDQLLSDFPQPRYEDACNTFRLTAGRLVSQVDSAKANLLIKRAITDSKTLLQRHPDTLTYISPAIRGYWMLATISSTNMDMEGALVHAVEANDCFEDYLDEHFDQVWVQSLFLEKQVGNVEIHYANGKYAEALKYSTKCLEVIGARIENAAYRLAGLTIKYRMHATRYRIFQELNQTAEMQQELDELQIAAKMALEFEQCRAECLKVGESFQLPESVLSILRKPIAGGDGTQEKHMPTE